MRSVVTLRFICPSTQGDLEYRLRADAKTLIERWSKNIRCKCPYCEGVHDFSFRAGYVDGALSQVAPAAATPGLAQLLAR